MRRKKPKIITGGFFFDALLEVLQVFLHRVAADADHGAALLQQPSRFPVDLDPGRVTTSRGLLQLRHDCHPPSGDSRHHPSPLVRRREDALRVPGHPDEHHHVRHDS